MLIQCLSYGGTEEEEDNIPIFPCFLIFAEIAAVGGGITSKVSKSKFARGGT